MRHRLRFRACSFNRIILFLHRLCVLARGSHHFCFAVAIVRQCFLSDLRGLEALTPLPYPQPGYAQTLYSNGSRASKSRRSLDALSN